MAMRVLKRLQSAQKQDVPHTMREALVKTQAV